MLHLTGGLLSPLLMLVGARLGLVVAGLTIAFVTGLYLAHAQGWLPVVADVLSEAAVSAVIFAFQSCTNVDHGRTSVLRLRAPQPNPPAHVDV